ncbi:MAG TPA: hypothetical protein VGH28_00425 [Polyangiaceae bacterium]|jgi:hypothetical protein
MGPYNQGSYEYEFDAQQNATISSAALWARVLGVTLIVAGVASLVNCNVISFVLDLVIGIYFLGGGSSLSMVVNTQGNDVAHMMQALGKLGTAFKIRVIFTIVVVVLMCIFVALVMLLAIAGSSR